MERTWSADLLDGISIESGRHGQLEKGKGPVPHLRASKRPPPSQNSDMGLLHSFHSFLLRPLRPLRHAITPPPAPQAPSSGSGTAPSDRLRPLPSAEALGQRGSTLFTMDRARKGKRR